MKRWICALILIAVSAALVAGLACYPSVSDDTAALTDIEKTLSDIQTAKRLGAKTAGGISHTDIIRDITDAYITEDGFVKVSIIQLTDQKIEAFNRAFPDAEGVVFEEAIYYPPQPEESDIILSETNGRVIAYMNEAPTATGASYAVENNTEDMTFLVDYTGASDSVEQLIDGKWYKVPEVKRANGGAKAEAGGSLSQRPGSVRWYTMDWQTKYGTLPPGEYRLIPRLLVEYSGAKYGKYYEDFYIAIEFEIK